MLMPPAAALASPLVNAAIAGSAKRRRQPWDFLLLGARLPAVVYCAWKRSLVVLGQVFCTRTQQGPFATCHSKSSPTPCQRQ